MRADPVIQSPFTSGAALSPSSANLAAMVGFLEKGIVQGFRELSNVSPAEAMVGLIAGSRFYEASQRVLRAISDALQLNTRP